MYTETGYMHNDHINAYNAILISETDIGYVYHCESMLHYNVSMSSVGMWDLNIWPHKLNMMLKIIFT